MTCNRNLCKRTTNSACHGIKIDSINNLVIKISFIHKKMQMQEKEINVVDVPLNFMTIVFMVNHMHTP